MWNLKLSRGSINMPRNFIAGTADSVVTLLRGDIRLGFCGEFESLKLI